MNVSMYLGKAHLLMQLQLFSLSLISANESRKALPNHSAFHSEFSFFNSSIVSALIEEISQSCYTLTTASLPTLRASKLRYTSLLHYIYALSCGYNSLRHKISLPMYGRCSERITPPTRYCASDNTFATCENTFSNNLRVRS